jgi:hypothetical protein
MMDIEDIMGADDLSFETWLVRVTNEYGYDQTPESMMEEYGRVLPDFWKARMSPVEASDKLKAEGGEPVDEDFFK